MSKLIKSYPEYMDDTVGGIFKDLKTSYATTFTWLDNADVLDAEYYGNHSGNKEISPIIDKFIEYNVDNEVPSPYVLTTTQRTLLAKIIANKFESKWTKLYAILAMEYNPIENYSMVEEETPEITHTHSVSNDYEVSDTKTNAFKRTSKEEPSQDYAVTQEKSVNTDLSVETETGSSAEVYGFNSSTAVPSNDATGGSTVTTTGDKADNTETTVTTQDGYITTTEEGSANDNVETNTHTQSGSTIDEETGSRTLTRSGNIGVTTSQQMIESEIALWQWNFFDTVYKDIDTVLTSPKYNIERGKI